MAKNTYQKLIDALFAEPVQLGLGENAPAAGHVDSSGLTQLKLSVPEALPAPAKTAA